MLRDTWGVTVRKNSFFLAFDKTRNMEHPGTSNNLDNYEKNM